jgi:membrane fusion protein, multidrug efflux system
MRKSSIIFATALAVALAGCGRQSAQQGGAPPPPEVGVVTLAAESVPLTTELPGRLEAVRVAEVRARATGIILKRLFEEGADVKAGDVLFQIDPAPLQASYDSAKATLARAEATLAQAHAKAERFKALVAIHGVSKQDYDDAVATELQSQADVATGKAAVETAGLNLGYASVTAPISGRIGAAKVTEGALASQPEATLMALIQQMDPIYFDFTQSSTEILRLKRSLEAGQFQEVAAGQAKVTLLLEDGTAYSEPGKLLFSDITVDPTTGMVTLRAEFPNPRRLLLPGMFGRARLELAVDNRAITVMQRGIALGAGGTATAMVVGPDNKVEVRLVKIDRAVGSKWIVTEGLKAGDRVIVDGLQKAPPGTVIKPVPFEAGTNTPAATPPQS